MSGPVLPHLSDEPAKLRVVVCDDDAGFRRLVGRALPADRFEVREAANGDDALELVRSWRPRFLLLDVSMPGTDGFEVCEIVKSLRETRGTQVVMITGRDTPDDLAEGRRVEADAYFVKPVVLRDLIDWMDPVGSGAPLRTSGAQ